MIKMIKKLVFFSVCLTGAVLTVPAPAQSPAILFVQGDAPNPAIQPDKLVTLNKFAPITGVYEDNLLQSIWVSQVDVAGQPITGAFQKVMVYFDYYDGGSRKEVEVLVGTSGAPDSNGVFQVDLTPSIDAFAVYLSFSSYGMTYDYVRVVGVAASDLTPFLSQQVRLVISSYQESYIVGNQQLVGTFTPPNSPPIGGAATVASNVPIGEIGLEESPIDATYKTDKTFGEFKSVTQHVADGDIYIANVTLTVQTSAQNQFPTTVQIHDPSGAQVSPTVKAGTPSADGLTSTYVFKSIKFSRTGAPDNVQVSPLLLTSTALPPGVSFTSTINVDPLVANIGTATGPATCVYGADSSGVRKAVGIVTSTYTAP